MKVKILLLSAIALFFMSPISTADTIRIAAIDWCPFICLNDENPGFLVEYVNEIYKRSNKSLNITIYPWSRAIKRVKEGKDHALLSPAKHEAPDLVYPDTPIGAQRWHFFKLKTNPWTSSASFDGVKVIYPKDALPRPLEKYKNLIGFKEKPYNDKYLNSSIAMMLKNRIDLLVSHYSTTTLYLKKNNLENEIISSGEIDQDPLYLAFSPAPQNKQIIEEYMKLFEKEIAILIEEGFIEKILLKYGLE